MQASILTCIEQHWPQCDSTRLQQLRVYPAGAPLSFGRGGGLVSPTDTHRANYTSPLLCCRPRPQGSCGGVRVGLAAQPSAGAAGGARCDARRPAHPVQGAVSSRAHGQPLHGAGGCLQPWTIWGQLHGHAVKAAVCAWTAAWAAIGSAPNNYAPACWYSN